MSREDIAARLFSFVLRRGPDECWPWRGSTRKNRRGVPYGKLKVDGRTLYAHRVALELSGVRLTAQSLHSCDNTLCCNPAHLRNGTQRENVADAMGKGRMHEKRGADGKFISGKGVSDTKEGRARVVFCESSVHAGVRMRQTLCLGG